MAGKRRLRELESDLDHQHRQLEALRAAVGSGQHHINESVPPESAELRAALEDLKHDASEQAQTLRRVGAALERLGELRDAEERQARRERLESIRMVCDRVLPRQSRVLVASNGDDQMLQLRGRRASHFPQGQGGAYAGRDPESSNAAVEHLKALRSRGAEFLLISASCFWWLDHYGALREYLNDRCRLIHHDERCSIYDLRATDGKPRWSRIAGRPKRRKKSKSKRVSSRPGGLSLNGMEYAQLRDRIRDAVASAVPKHSTVAVVSKGDQELLQLGSRKAWHFPQGSDGRYAGHYPADGNAAVAHLWDLRVKGAEFLVLPSTAVWWLSHYKELREILEGQCKEVSGAKDDCLIYDLRPLVAPGKGRSSRSVVRTVHREPTTADLDRHVCQLVDSRLPSDASLVLVSDHNLRLTEVGGRRLRHVTEDKASSAVQARTRLEQFRAEGAQFLIVPDGCHWWRDRPGFRRHVEHRYPVVVRDRTGVIFHLSPGPSPARTSPKVSVLCWDMGHNPLGRAHVLADLLSEGHEVEIIGPHFDRYGKEIWKPLQNSSIPMRTYRGALFPHYFQTMEELARRIDGDVIYVSKPRLPSYGLGILAKAFWNRPLILDCDDRESSFFASNGVIRSVQGHHDLSAGTRELDFYNPFGQIWTSSCESLVQFADHVTVSNELLQELYGGTIIPHARDERVFDPALYDRDQARAELGIMPDQRMILFVGTPRKHKGIQEIVRALSVIGDERYKLCVTGTGDYLQLRKEVGPLHSWMQEIPVQPFSRLPAILSAADLVCVLQDVSSEVSKYQIPAKVTDAIAMGVPCIATPVGPLRRFVEKGVVHSAQEGPLHESIEAILTDPASARDAALKNRQIFLYEYSYSAVRPTLEGAIRDMMSEPPPLAPNLQDLIGFQRSAFGNGRDRDRGGDSRPTLRGRSGPSGSSGVSPIPAATLGSPLKDQPSKPKSQLYDIVVFWKHNDTGIYGRRQEMLAKYLAKSDRVRQVIHFDAPVDLKWIRRHLRPREVHVNHERLLALQTLKRVVRAERQRKVHFYTFLHRGNDSRARGQLIRRLLPSSDTYVEWISSVLEKHGVGDGATTVFWAYPRLFVFPEIADAHAPDLIVSDIVDDDRAWLEPDSEHYSALTRNYKEILERSDVVMASNEYMRDAMRCMGPEIHLVPNGCEYPDPDPPSSRPPRELSAMRGPIVGYVGNLSSRIDIPLLERVALARPEWNLVFIGSAHLDRQILRLSSFPNVHFLGVKPYAEAKRYIRAFDVAIIPHTDDGMTRAMHPLKAFVYAAQNVPVVSSDIANLGELGNFIQISSGASDFIWRIELALAAGKAKEIPSELAEVLERNSWAQRAKTVLEILDAHQAATGGQLIQVGSEV